MSTRTAWEQWEQWWFTPADPRVYASLRIGYGLLGLWLYAPMWKDLDWTLTDAGVYPTAARMHDYGPERLSLLANPLWTIDELPGVRVFFAAVLVAFGLVAVGFGGRWTLAAAWAGVVSMLNRDALWTDGSDVIMRVFGAYLLLMPVTRSWSLDAWWARRRALGRGGPAPSGPVAGWPLRLFQLQVCLLYVKTGIVKLLDFRWQEGVAVYQSLSTSYFWRFRMEGFLSDRWFQAWTVAATYATLVFEILFPLVLLPRLRRPWLLAGVGLHLGIAAFMNLGGFSEAVLWTYLAFVAFRARGDR